MEWPGSSFSELRDIKYPVRPLYPFVSIRVYSWPKICMPGLFTNSAGLMDWPTGHIRNLPVERYDPTHSVSGCVAQALSAAHFRTHRIAIVTGFTVATPPTLTTTCAAPAGMESGMRTLI